MIKVLSLFLFLLTCAVSIEAAEYVYDQKDSRVQFTLRHFGLITMSGEFERFQGAFRFDHEQLEKTEVGLTIATGSVTSKNSQMARDLKSKHFFWPDKFPEITFVSREIKNINGKKFDILGDLTIRGITKAVVFKTELLSEIDETNSETPLLFHTKTTIKRKDFNLGTDNWMNPIMIVTDEKVIISLDVKGLPNPARLFTIKSESN